MIRGERVGCILSLLCVEPWFCAGPPRLKASELPSKLAVGGTPTFCLFPGVEALRPAGLFVAFEESSAASSGNSLDESTVKALRTLLPLHSFIDSNFGSGGNAAGASPIW